MQQVYPQSAVSDGFLRDLHNNFPQALIIYHAVYNTWQLYERVSRDWNAERLFNAVMYYHAHKDDPKLEQWWEWPGAPQVINDGLPYPPGDWLLEVLGQGDFHRYPGGMKQWYRDRETAFFAREEDRRRQRHEDHKEVARSGFYRHARDFERGDPLAGHRKWVHTVTRDLK